MHTYCGTPTYMAPEIFETLESKIGYEGEAADTWALGVCLFVCVTGNVPMITAQKQDAHFSMLKYMKYDDFWVNHE